MRPANFVLTAAMWSRKARRTVDPKSNKPPFMKKFVLALLSALVFVSPAFATVGGPWSGNIVGNTVSVNPSNINGTYQGTIKGKNLTGLMHFTSTDNGQVVTSSTTFLVVGTGSNATLVPNVTTTVSSANGFASIYYQGSLGQATLDTAIDLGARKITGFIDGNTARGVAQVIVRPATSTSAAAAWSIGNNTVFIGEYAGNLSKQWAANNFTGKGYLMVTRVDLDAFNADLVNNPTTANPHITTAPVSIKVSGVKTTDTPAVYTPVVPTPTLPSITPTAVP